MNYDKYDDGFENHVDEGLKITTGERFVKIWDFMLGDLRLEKTELLVYAIIFAMFSNFSDAFYGSREYLQMWTNSSKKTVDRALKSLEEKQLITRIIKQYGRIKRVVYLINSEALPDCDMFALENHHRDNMKIIREHERKRALGLAD